MTIRGHAVEKYVTGQRLDTSAGRWSTLLAERWRHCAGELPPVLPRDTEVVVLLRGQTLVERRGAGLRQRTHARPGTVWLCPAGIREDYINAHQGADECLHIFLPGRPFAETMLRDLDLDPAHAELRYEAVARDPFIAEVAHQIRRELVEETSAGTLLIETLGLALSAYLVRHYSATGVRPKTVASREKPLDPRRLSRVAAFIEQNIEQPLSVAELASVACTSPAHFARSFKVATGQTPHAFVSQQRLEHAKRLLACDGHSMTEIACASGFSSQSNFARAFRKAVGVSPRDFRNRSGRRCLTCGGD